MDKKGKFAKKIVIIDLICLLIFSVWGMALATLQIDASATLSVIFTVAGGELLLLMIKKIFNDKGGNDDEY